MTTRTVITSLIVALAGAAHAQSDAASLSEAVSVFQEACLATYPDTDAASSSFEQAAFRPEKIDKDQQETAEVFGIRASLYATEDKHLRAEVYQMYGERDLAGPPLYVRCAVLSQGNNLETATDYVLTAISKQWPNTEVKEQELTPALAKHYENLPTNVFDMSHNGMALQVTVNWTAYGGGRDTLLFILENTVPLNEPTQ